MSKSESDKWRRPKNGGADWSAAVLGTHRSTTRRSGLREATRVVGNDEEIHGHMKQLVRVLTQREISTAVRPHVPRSDVNSRHEHTVAPDPSALAPLGRRARVRSETSPRQRGSPRYAAVSRLGR